MSTWNPEMGRVILTTPVDINIAVKADRVRVKVGSPCSGPNPSTPVSTKIFGELESVSVELVWDSHKQFHDSTFQYRTLNLLKELDGKDLLEEVVRVCPQPVKELMTGLVSTLDCDLTQIRYMEIGPVKWWLQNIWRCPKLAKLLIGESLESPFVVSGISARLINLPIYSRLSDHHGLRFMELQVQMSLLTEHLLSQDQSTIHCKYYLRDSWSESASTTNAGGMLLKRGMKRKRFEELDDGYDIVSPQIVGLGESKLIHGILGSPCFLMSSFMTTRSGLEYEKNSRRLICQLPLYGDITDPLTMPFNVDPVYDPLLRDQKSLQNKRTTYYWTNQMGSSCQPSRRLPALVIAISYNQLDLFLMLRPRRTADYEYLHDKITEERIFPRTYEVHCSTEYHADFLGSCEEINCEPIKYSPFEGLNMFRRGRSMLSGMLAVGPCTYQSLSNLSKTGWLHTIRSKNFRETLKYEYTWRGSRFFGHMNPCEVCEDLTPKQTCKCALNTSMIPGLCVTEARLSSPAKLNLPCMIGDRRIPANYGPSACNNQIPLHTHSRAGLMIDMVYQQPYICDAPSQYEATELDKIRI